MPYSSRVTFRIKYSASFVLNGLASHIVTAGKLVGRSLTILILLTIWYSKYSKMIWITRPEVITENKMNKRVQKLLSNKLLFWNILGKHLHVTIEEYLLRTCFISIIFENGKNKFNFFMPTFNKNVLINSYRFRNMIGFQLSKLFFYKSKIS